MRKTIGALALVAALTGCGGTTAAEDDVEVEPSPTQTPPPSPAPVEPSTVIEISGDYGADLAEIGIIPDDADSYGEYMARNICESEISHDPLEFYAYVNRYGEPGQSDRGPDMVLLTTEYYCPERTALAQEELGDLGYL